MSLEDKAKEYARKVEDSFSTEHFESGYKQALKDMMERAEELQLPYIRMYKIIAEELGKLKEGK